MRSVKTLQTYFTALIQPFQYTFKGQKRCCKVIVIYCVQCVPKEGYPLKSNASAASMNLNALTQESTRMRKTFELSIFMPFKFLKFNMRD